MNNENLRIGDATEKLICALREELLEHGEMLALLDEQPRSGSGHSRSGVTDWLIAIHKQAAIIRVARTVREQQRRELAGFFCARAEAGFAELSRMLSEGRRNLVSALLEEIALCWVRVLRGLVAANVSDVIH
jgi:hypothetical protein